MPDPVVILTDHGSIELRQGSGKCIVEGCRKMGGNMAEFTVHHTAYERAQRFIVCGQHFALAVGRMMEGAEQEAALSAT